MNKLFLTATLAFGAARAHAAPQTVTLNVPGMTCAACPITVKQAISRVDGVNKVAMSHERHQAVVIFDDTKTSVRKLIQASENAGYRATVKR